jgi:MFS family permease
MLGLGLGALVGGRLADAMPQRILLVFCLFEAGIAAFGLFSADLILSMSQLFAGLSRPAAALLSFLTLLFPTICMGATLPMLVADAFRESRNVGVSTGTLYFINTAGAAAGACAVGFVLFYWIDVRQTVMTAAALNIVASLAVGSVYWRR